MSMVVSERLELSAPASATAPRSPTVPPSRLSTWHQQCARVSCCHRSRVELGHTKQATQRLMSFHLDLSVGREAMGQGFCPIILNAVPAEKQRRQRDLVGLDELLG